MSMTDPRSLTDDALIRRIDALAASSRATTADLINHLVELECRNLHLACGLKSLFGYCRRVLKCSESASYDRMRAAHAARRFPVVIPMLAEGLVHLTAVRLLWPYLKDQGEDHLALLGGAIHQSTRDVKKLIARWFPRPDVVSSVRKLPERHPLPPPTIAAPPTADPRLLSTTGPAPCGGAPPPLQLPAPRPPSGGTVSPLSLARYEFRFTGDDETAALLQEATELLSHSLPDGDMAAIFKQGLRLVVEHARRQRYAATDRAGRPRPIAAESREIPAHVQREVWRRDGGQCSFVGRNGWRCEERRYLEYHHLKPWIAGGMPSVENISLRCHAHNQYEAKMFFARGA
jgi:hypothetical protein